MLNRRDLMLGAAAGALVAPSMGVAATATNFSLRNLAGQEVSLSNFAGRVVYLSFWATWCGPCKVEMQHIHAYHQELEARGFTALLISIDDSRAGMAVKQYIRKQRYSQEIVLLDKQSEVVSIYNPKKTVPFGVLVGRNNQIVKVWEGFNPGEEVVVKEAILAELDKKV